MNFNSLNNNFTFLFIILCFYLKFEIGKAKSFNFGQRGFERSNIFPHTVWNFALSSFESRLNLNISFIESSLYVHNSLLNLFLLDVLLKLSVKIWIWFVWGHFAKLSIRNHIWSRVSIVFQFLLLVERLCLDNHRLYLLCTCWIESLIRKTILDPPLKKT